MTVVETKKWCRVLVVGQSKNVVKDHGCGSVGEHEMRSDRGRERVRQDDNRVERVGWMVKSWRRYVGWEDCREL